MRLLSSSRFRLLVGMVLLALVAAACTGGDDDPVPDPSASEGAAPGGEESAELEIPVLEGAEIDVEPAIIDAVTTWIDEESGLTEMLKEELVLASASMTRDVHHLTYEQQHGGVAVRGAQLVVHVRDTGEVLAASQSLSTTLPGEGTTEELTQDEAREIAVKAITGTIIGEPEVLSTWLEDGPELRLGWEVRISTEERIDYSVVVDATTGDVLSVDQLSSTQQSDASGEGSVVDGAEVAQAGGCAAPAPPSACIFVVDPIFAAGTPAITAAEANRTLVGVPLANLTDPTDGNLVGRYVQVFPDVRPDYIDPDNVFGEGGRGGQDPTFEGGMVYYWIDYTQQLMQSLGYDYHGDDPVDVIPIDPTFTDNAAYLPIFDLIVMGTTSNGAITLAEDAQVVVHEYGHAVVESVVPNILGAEGGAFNEGFADLLMIFTTLEFRNGDIGCLSAWFGRELGLPGGCIRRIDTDKVYPQDLVAEVHLDGEIYTGAVWDVFTDMLQRDAGLVPEDCQDRAANPCDAVRDEVLGILLGSLPFLTPQVTLNDAAAAMALSDEIFYGGRNADLISQVMGQHGLDTTSNPSVMMASGPMELMAEERSPSQVALKIIHENRGDLAVELQVVDASGEPLCLSTFLTPDTADTADNVTGRYDLAGSTCEAFLPPGPNQVFQLVVVDIAASALGELFQFNVFHDGVEYRASGLPQAIPDADGRGIVATIPDTDIGAVPMADPQPPLSLIHI